MSEVLKKRLKIALDYDLTYTEDSMLWLAFAFMAIGMGHDVMIVTARGPVLDEIHDLAQSMIIYCDGKSKIDVCKEIGWEPDIWIDDNPAGIILGSTYTQEQLQEWRENGRK